MSAVLRRGHFHYGCIRIMLLRIDPLFQMCLSLMTHDHFFLSFLYPMSPSFVLNNPFYCYLILFSAPQRSHFLRIFCNPRSDILTLTSDPNPNFLNQVKSYNELSVGGIAIACDTWCSREKKTLTLNIPPSILELMQLVGIIIWKAWFNSFLKANNHNKVVKTWLYDYGQQSKITDIIFGHGWTVCCPTSVAPVITHITKKRCCFLPKTQVLMEVNLNLNLSWTFWWSNEAWTLWEY